MGKLPMDRVIIVSHGSLKKEANNLQKLTELVSKKISFNLENIKHAYLQHATPSVEDTIRQCINEGAMKIIIFPLFISSGKHVKNDIPEIISKFKKETPHIDIVYTEPLGLDEKIAEIIAERIKEAIKSGDEPI
jgi:sirohydrochlorin ferrochelatase